MKLSTVERLLAGTVCAAAACGANAQDITTYGRIDLGLVKQSGGRPWAVDRGATNLLGFRGSEQLGGGLAATFKLEHRFRGDAGSVERSTVFWQGESTVGLASTAWGSLRLGRAATAMNARNWAFEPWYQNGVNGSVGAFQLGNFTFSSDGTNDAVVGSANFVRSPNSVFYNSPSLAGFSAALSTQVEKDANAKARNVSVSLNYDQGPVALMLGGERNTGRDTAGFVGASYAFGPFKVMGSYTKIEYEGAGKESSYVLAGSYTIGSGLLRAGYGRDPELDVSKIGLGYLYGFSRRTSVYLDTWRQMSGSPGDSFNGVAMGISHAF
jgi:predicted porin